MKLFRLALVISRNHCRSLLPVRQGFTGGWRTPDRISLSGCERIPHLLLLARDPGFPQLDDGSQ
jgi:hypothetical protein